MTTLGHVQLEVLGILHLGPASIPELADQTGRPYHPVYCAVRSLQRRGLVRPRGPVYRRTWVAVDEGVAAAAYASCWAPRAAGGGAR